MPGPLGRSQTRPGSVNPSPTPHAEALELFLADSKCWSFPRQLRGEDEKQERSKQPRLCARERTGLGWAAPAQGVLRLGNFRDQLPTLRAFPTSSFQHRIPLCSLRAGQGLHQCHKDYQTSGKLHPFYEKEDEASFIHHV